ncbi:uncharacterized protein LOC114538353 isoform X3 [Dendronephthya gigantea]|uniref:uncharacterized protein LOC114538353 isoform X3 n=1 Tax=Dendronephthya gigantea TaxID=151771 RepID=UPI00106C8A5F|nr:uncharacterized protein LOC114538353 isoform X3 [Dendronephthya gigantea]
MNRLQIICSLLFFMFCDCLEFDIDKCVAACEKKNIATVNDKELCGQLCFKESLERMLKQDFERKLPKPARPRAFKIGWERISLVFNTTELANYSGLNYILEVKPNWNGPQKSDVFTVYPYIQKYHKTNETTYLVQSLEPNTDYQFRVMAVTTNETSTFSNWSNWSNWSNTISTTSYCSKPPCGVSRIRIQLTSDVPYKGMVILKSVFYWEPTILKPPFTDYTWNREFIRLASAQSSCADHFTATAIQNEKKSLKEQDIFTNKNLTTYTPTKDLALYYDCWYFFQLHLQPNHFSRKEFAVRKWTFHIPDCIVVNDTKICGCPYVPIQDDKRHHVLNVTIASSNTSLIAHVNWNDNLWRNDVDVKYYLIELYDNDIGTSLYIEYYDAHANVHNYNASFKLKAEQRNKKHRIKLTAFHRDHCNHYLTEIVHFFAKEPCLNATCRMNSTCRPDYFKGEYKCECHPDFRLLEDKCVDLCRRRPCGENETCNVVDRRRICSCTPGFENVSGICEPVDRCRNNPTECTRENNASDENYKGIIAGVVPALIIVIVIAVAVIFRLRYFHRKRINFIQREFEDAVSGNHSGTLTNPYQSQIELVTLPESSSKEMNLLYVMQKDLVIPDDLKSSIGSFELPGDRVKLRSMIGKGAFGEVYIGEAKGVNNNPEWTTVAIKTLAESVREEDVHDFLREIQLMKDLGKHENVIQMYGCCTSCRPICLVLEYASGGNLINYLRSIKKKCKEIAAARAYAFINSEKEKYKKFFEPGEMPEASTSFPFDPYKRPLGSKPVRVDEAEALNLEVAAKINEELRNALDPKELESFARQIASGMEHVAGLGIVHRDLAARNILLDKSKVLKISDFGLSREGTYVKQTHGKIPFRWLSIEAIIERFYSTASDVWAFGVVLWEICTLGEVPYSTVSDRDLKDFLLSGKRMEKVESCTDEIYEIMLKCWNHLPEERPSFSELTKCLWDLEHGGNTYVNVEGFIHDDRGQGDESQEEEAEKDNNNLHDNSDAESSPAEDSVGGFDNRAFSLSGEEDLNTSDDKQLIRKFKDKDSSKSKVANENKDQVIHEKVGNGVKVCVVQLKRHRQ